MKRMGHHRILDSVTKAVIFFIITVLSAASIGAESFRVHKTVMLPVFSTGEKNTVQAGINDAIAISLPEDMTFVQGIELLFKVPQEVAYWMDSVAWSLYNDISPAPTAENIDYEGQRITVGTFGNSLSLVLKIPLEAKNTIKKDAYSTYVDTIPDFLNNTVFTRLQLAMKGTSDALLESEFEVSARPIYINKGKLTLSVAPPADTELQAYTVFIDGNAVEFDEAGLLLTPGKHTVNLISDAYRNEVRTFSVEQAKIIDLAIQLRDIAPTVRIAAPENSVIYLDDQQLEDISAPIPVTQGNHIIRFNIGGYELIKTVSAVNGRTYAVSINLDASISEEE